MKFTHRSGRAAREKCIEPAILGMRDFRSRLVAALSRNGAKTGKKYSYFDAENNISAIPIVLHAGTVELGSPHLLFHGNGVSGGYRVVAKNKGEQFLVARYSSLSSSLPLVADWDREVRK